MNPHRSSSALANSFYSKPDKGVEGGLSTALAGTNLGNSPLFAQAVDLHANFREYIRVMSFPCVLGRSAINKDNYRFGLYADANDSASLNGLARDLWSFVHEQPFGGNYSTFIACFAAPDLSSEDTFEALLWKVLLALHDQDEGEWDPATSSNPEDSTFSFSFARRSYFIVGLHPNSSRFSRRFERPALVFNAHFQFQDLKTRPGKTDQETAFQMFQARIRENDKRIQGYINPSLDDVEAKQYSGKKHDPIWKCPFHTS